MKSSAAYELAWLEEMSARLMKAKCGAESVAGGESVAAQLSAISEAYEEIVAALNVWRLAGSLKVYSGAVYQPAASAAS
jgi:hypothetical protein